MLYRLLVWMRRILRTRRWREGQEMLDRWL